MVGLEGQGVRDDADAGGGDGRALVGVVAFGLLGAAGLFALPAMRSLGIGFYPGFWALAAVELVAAFGVAVSVMRMRRGRR
ncbi:MAG: hypothetical protein ABEH40_04885 [Haloferacaceae archaeon]